MIWQDQGILQPWWPTTTKRSQRQWTYLHDKSHQTVIITEARFSGMEILFQSSKKQVFSTKDWLYSKYRLITQLSEQNTWYWQELQPTLDIFFYYVCAKQKMFAWAKSQTVLVSCESVGPTRIPEHVPKLGTFCHIYC